MSAPLQQLLAALRKQADPDALLRLLNSYIDAYIVPADDASAAVETLADALMDEVHQAMRADPARAQVCADLLFHLAAVTSSPAVRALGHLAVANAAAIGGLGDYTAAIEHCADAASIFSTLARHVDAADARITQVYALAMLGRAQEAIEIGEAAATVLRKAGAWQPLATLTINVAIAYGRIDDDRAALRLLDETSILYQSLGEETSGLLAGIELNRALVLRNLGHISESLDANQMARCLLHQLGQTAEVGHAHQATAVTYFQLGRYNEALEELDAARAIFQRFSRRADLLVTDLYLSECLLRLRRFDDALARSRAARDLARDIGSRFEEGYALLNHARSLAGLGEFTAANAGLNAVQTLFVDNRNGVWALHAQLECAATFYAASEFTQALTLAQQCAAAYRHEQRPIYEAHATMLAAQSAFKAGERRLAVRLCAQILAFTDEQPLAEVLFGVHFLLGQLSEQQGNDDLAISSYRTSIEWLERLRGTVMVEYRSTYLEDKESVYAHLVELLIKQGDAQEALRFVQRAKSRALAELLSFRIDLSLTARSDADRPLIARLQQLRRRRDRLFLDVADTEEFVPPALGERAADPVSLHAQILSLEQQITELWHTLLIRDAAYAREALAPQLQTELPDPWLKTQTCLLEYFFTEDQLLVFVVTSMECKVVKLALSQAELERYVDILRRLWHMVAATPVARHASLLDTAERVLARLHEALLTPVAASLAGREQLIVVPHGGLHYIPFHALVDPQQSPNSYLLDRHQVSYLPSSALLRHVLAPRKNGTRDLALGYSCNGRLPFATSEAQGVADILQSEALLEEEVTRACLNTAAPALRILHIATHGVFRADNPLFSGLQFADGWLTTLDLFNLRTPAALITLSACQTGRAQIGGGDELQGLMRAALVAGASALLVSQWAVADQSTSLLMGYFYTELQEGAGCSEALQRAQQRLRREHPQFAHPYFWAPFFLVGNPGPIAE